MRRARMQFKKDRSTISSHQSCLVLVGWVGMTACWHSPVGCKCTGLVKKTKPLFGRQSKHNADYSPSSWPFACPLDPFQGAKIAV